MPDEQPTKNTSAPDMSWRGPKDALPDRQTLARRRSRRSTLLTGALIALVSALVVWVLYIVGSFPEGAYLLTINIGVYDRPAYPVVPFAKQDSERLKRYFTHREAETKTLQLLRTELHNLASRSEPSVVVHITALAVVHGGEVYLLPGDADPGLSDKWLKLAYVIDAVGRCPARKLLILDLAHPMADPKLGVLSDRVAETVEDYLKKTMPGFMVLCPCSAGESSLASPVLRSSVLSYYLELGLQGHADGAGPTGKKDKTITARELCSFVETEVQRWAHVNRWQRQKPVIVHGSAADFPLLNLRRRPSPEMPPTAAEPWPDLLRKEWKRQDERFQNRLFAAAPDFFQQRSAELLRQEQRWQGGVAPDGSLFTDYRGPAPAKTPASSLAVALRPAKTNVDLVELVRGYIASAAENKDKSDPVKEDMDAVGKARAALNVKFKDVPFRDKAWTIVEALAALADWDKSQVGLAVDFLQPTLPDHEFVETLYLQEFADYAQRVRKQDRKWRGDIVTAVFKTMRAREAVLAALSDEPSLLPWIASAIALDADVDRRKGEKGFLWLGGKYWEEAKQSLESAEKKYAAALKRLQTLQQCRRTLSEALAVLPGYAPMLSEGIEPDAVAEEYHTQAVRFSKDLADFFADPPTRDRAGDAADQRITAVKDQTELLKKRLEKLREILGNRLAEVKDGDGPETLEKILALLKCPLLASEERAKLQGRASDLAKKLQERSDLEFGQEAAHPNIPKLPGGFIPVQQALLRARLARDFLMLEGGANLEKVSRAMQQKITKPADLEPLEIALREAFAAQASARAAAAKSGGDDAVRELSAWLAENYAAESRHWTPAGPMNEPAARLPELGAFYRKLARQLQPIQ